MQDQGLSVVSTSQDRERAVLSTADLAAGRAIGAEIDDRVMHIFTLVGEAVSGATKAFVKADREAARTLVQGDELIDELTDEAERLVMDALLNWEEIDFEARRHLLLVLRVLPELERSGDLAEHIASHASQGLARWLTPRARNLVSQMGELGAEMWRLATEAYGKTDGDSADLLRVRDDEIDDLHVSLTSELAADRVSVPVAIEMALVARYFERLGDHAVNVTRRLQASLSGA